MRGIKPNLVAFFALLFVFTISIQAEAIETSEMILKEFYEMSEVEHVGGKDADVFSKKKRHTTVSVTTSDISLNADGTAVLLTVTYSVLEGHKNHTHLQSDGEIKLPAPGGYKIIEAGTGKTDVSYGGTFHGKDHDWHNVSDQVVGSYFSSLEVKFDGNGDDNHGNARMKANVAVPVVLIKWDK